LVWGALVLEIAVVPVLAGLLVLVMSGFGGGSDGSLAAVQGPQFPDFVYNTQTSEDAYRLAVDNRQLFSQMPCYCGCSRLDMPHQDLDQCFFAADGGFDQHAAYCTICADIAVDAVRWQSEGKTTTEVRRLVDEKFGEVGPGTNTPPVSE
jgi:hypothetical protein